MTFLLQALALVSQIAGALAAVVGGNPVPIRTYLGKTHVEITFAVIP